jgi:hypothetical protein
VTEGRGREGRGILRIRRTARLNANSLDEFARGAGWGRRRAKTDRWSVCGAMVDRVQIRWIWNPGGIEIPGAIRIPGVIQMPGLIWNPGVIRIIGVLDNTAPMPREDLRLGGRLLGREIPTIQPVTSDAIRTILAINAARTRLSSCTLTAVFCRWHLRVLSADLTARVALTEIPSKPHHDHYSSKSNLGACELQSPVNATRATDVTAPDGV